MKTDGAPLKRFASLISACSDDGVLPFLSLDLVESGTGQAVSGAEVPSRAAPESGAARVQPGDVLFGKLRPYLAKSLLVESSSYASTELLALRSNPSLEPRYLGYLIRSEPFIGWTVATSEGSKMPRTSWEKVGDYAIELPPVSEQGAIADYLDAETARIDALITKKRRMIELLQERRSGLIENCMRSFVSELGELPLKHAVSDVTVGIVITPAKWYVDNGVLALRGVNVSAGRIDLTDTVFLSDEGHAANRKSTIRAGDIVVVRTGQAGAAAVVPADLDGANCIDLLLIRPSEVMDAQFLEYVLNSDWTIKHIAEHSVGTIQAHFNVGALRELPVPVPSLGEQHAAVTSLDQTCGRLDSMQQTLASQLDVLTERRQALITAVVTGELEIPGVAA